MRDFEEAKESKGSAREAAQRQRLPTKDQQVGKKKPQNSTDKAAGNEDKTCTVTDGEGG